MQAELGFTVRGTTDAALVLQHSIQAGVPANGLRWLWELQRNSHGPKAGVLAETDAEKVSSPSSSEHGQVCDQLDNDTVHSPCSKLLWLSAASWSCASYKYCTRAGSTFCKHHDPFAMCSHVM